MLARVVATTAAGVVGLAILGAVMGPAWSPVPLEQQIQPETTDTASGAAAGPPVGTYPVRAEIITVTLNGAEVEARLTMPVGAEEPVPGLVFVHGAGTGRFVEAFVEHAEDLATAGIATLVPNKRLDTYTTRHRDYVEMARDYGHSVAALRAVEGVDPSRVGVYGESEGCYILPVMGADDAALQYLIFTSAPVVPPRQQAAFAADSYLRNTGVPQGVFRSIPRAVGMAFPGGGFEYADFDPQPFHQRLTQPVYLAYGTADASMPLVQGPLQMIDDIAVAGNSQYTVRFYPEANHGIRVDGVLRPEFLPDLAGWVHGLPAAGTAAPRIAGDTPHQTFRADPVPQPRWFASGNIVLAWVLLGTGLVLLGPVVLAVGALARRRVAIARTLRGPLAALAAGSVVTLLGFLGYVAAVARLALEYERNDLVVQGGWIGVRLLGILTVVAAAVLVERSALVRSDEEQQVALGRFGRAGLAVTLAGCVLVLITLAYWGVYQLGI